MSQSLVRRFTRPIYVRPASTSAQYSDVLRRMSSGCPPSTDIHQYLRPYTVFVYSSEHLQQHAVVYHLGIRASTRSTVTHSRYPLQTRHSAGACTQISTRCISISRRRLNQARSPSHSSATFSFSVLIEPAPTSRLCPREQPSTTGLLNPELKCRRQALRVSTCRRDDSNAADLRHLHLSILHATGTRRQLRHKSMTRAICNAN